MPIKGRDSKTLEISPLDRLSQFFRTFSVSVRTRNDLTPRHAGSEKIL